MVKNNARTRTGKSFAKQSYIMMESEREIAKGMDLHPGARSKV
ncbi:MAG: hypothetical protein U9N82_11985 [Thermodesulfobacteriota bacterium]|nr:hypothetical protein [Thermodesulfobacteriota bacterium]